MDISSSNNTTTIELQNRTQMRYVSPKCPVFVEGYYFRAIQMTFNLFKTLCIIPVLFLTPILSETF